MTSLSLRARNGLVVRCLPLFVLCAVAAPSVAWGAPGDFIRTINNPVINTALTKSSNFGATLYASGPHLFVQNRGYSSQADNQGAVHVFDAISGSLMTTVQNPDPAHNAYFGAGIASNGDTVFIGNDYGNRATYSFPAYLFDRQSLQMERRLFPDYFDLSYGRIAVPLGNDYIIGSLPRYDFDRSGVGAVYVLNGQMGSFNHGYFLGANRPAPVPGSLSTTYPSSFAVSSERVVIGDIDAYTEVIPSGAVDVHDRSTGTFLYSLREPFVQREFSTRFGASVAMFGNRLFVGAPDELLPGVSGIVGAIHVYDLSTGDLIDRIANPRPFQASNFGATLAISGNFLVVGAPGNSTSGSNQTGLAFLHDAATGRFVSELAKPPTNLLDGFGASITVSPGYIAIGAPGRLSAGDRGAVYIYEGATPVPEPSSVALALGGLAVVVWSHAKTRRGVERGVEKGEGGELLLPQRREVLVEVGEVGVRGLVEEGGGHEGLAAGAAVFEVFVGDS